MKKLIGQAITAAALIAVSFVPAQAAHISFDDTDLNSITISAVDFEEGFFVNGAFLTAGLGNSGSVTLPDGVLHTFSGTWIDNGNTPADTPIELNFIFAESPLDARSGFGSNVTRFAGSFATIAGNFGGFFGGSFIAVDGPTADQRGGAVTIFPATGLGITFTPEPQGVPEPASLGLLGGALAVYAWVRRRRG